METLLVQSGQTDILLCGSNTVIKLFHDSVSEERVQREVDNTLNAKKHGINVPEIYDVIQKDQRMGIVMEYVKGPTITDVLSKTPYLIKTYARKLAHVQAQINGISASNFTGQRGFMHNAIKQTKARLGGAVDTVIRIFDDLPGGQRLCHNDLHQENIIFAERGPVILDWAEATVGNPIADVVHSILVQEHPVPAPIFKSSTIYNLLHNQYRRHFAKLYSREYRRITGISNEEIESWILPVAATRLFTKKSIEEKQWTEDYIKARIRDNKLTRRDT